MSGKPSVVISLHWDANLNEYKILSSKSFSLRTLKIFLPYFLASV